MTHPLIERLLTELGYPEINLANHDAFTARAGMNVIFFPGNPETVRDATDVAVVLPELVEAFAGQLRPGVVTDTFGDGKQLKRQYGFTEYPALVFVRDGDYVGTIMRVQDWADYLGRISNLFVAPPKRPPGFRIPVVAA
ncbi:MAG: hydrogenase-1 expression HyaE [Woeseiaceae bacterium]